MKVFVDYKYVIIVDLLGDDVDVVANGIVFDTERWGSGFIAVVTGYLAI